MKEMIYQQTRLKEPEILASGEHKGYNYYALSLGTHPCGYVEIPNNNKYFNVDYDNIPVECHGGLTYGRNYLHVEHFIAICSECGRTEDSRDIKDMPYCHCGARMDGEQK